MKSRPQAAVLLAAGESRRMGREAKQLLPWQGVPLVAYQTRELAAAPFSEIIVVLGHRSVEIEEAIASVTNETARVRTVVNECFRAGKASSIRCGVGALSTPAEAVLVLAVDQPRPRTLLERILEGHDSHCDRGFLITIPTRAQRRGHPPVFAASLIPELRAVREETEGLRAILRAHAEETAELEVADPAVLLDLNTPEAYREALRTFGEKPRTAF